MAAVPAGLVVPACAVPHDCETQKDCQGTPDIRAGNLHRSPHSLIRAAACGTPEAAVSLLPPSLAAAQALLEPEAALPHDQFRPALRGRSPPAAFRTFQQ